MQTQISRDENDAECGADCGGCTKRIYPGGNLAVTNADQIIPNINRLGQYFQNIVLTQIGIRQSISPLQTIILLKQPMTRFSWIMVLRSLAESLCTRN